MTRFRHSFLLTALLLSACTNDSLHTAENPDPNHTHADFAIFMNGEQMDFSKNEYMSGLPADDAAHDEDSEHKHEYLHLHDNVGTVIHSHKPGQTIGEFFASIGLTASDDCFLETCNTDDARWRMFVQQEEIPMNMDYVFSDVDQILVSYGATDAEIQEQFTQVTDDACLYSKTCPQRGDPPAENCISDPAIPCVVPLEDL